MPKLIDVSKLNEATVIYDKALRALPCIQLNGVASALKLNMMELKGKHSLINERRHAGGTQSYKIGKQLNYLEKLLGYEPSVIEPKDVIFITKENSQKYDDNELLVIGGQPVSNVTKKHPMEQKIVFTLVKSHLEAGGFRKVVINNYNHGNKHINNIFMNRNEKFPNISKTNYFNGQNKQKWKTNYVKNFNYNFNYNNYNYSHNYNYNINNININIKDKKNPYSFSWVNKFLNQNDYKLEIKEKEKEKPKTKLKLSNINSQKKNNFVKNDKKEEKELINENNNNNSKEEDKEEELDEEQQMQFYKNQKNFFKARKDIQEEPEDLEEDKDEDNKNKNLINNDIINNNENNNN